MQVTTIGVDLAKNVFQVHGITATEKVVFNKSLRRAQFLPFFAKLEPCLIGMESCSSAHHWARELTALGHEVRLIPPMYVKPYVKRGKSDAIDAEAICEAVGRPTMRFVPTKTPKQQAVQMLHRTRKMFVGQSTMLINAIRAHMAEFGIVAPVGRKGVEKLLEEIVSGGDDRIPELARDCLVALSGQLKLARRQILGADRRILAIHKSDEMSKRLEAIPGVGPLIAAALVASIPEPRAFASGRDMSAWIGLVPKQHSTGGKERSGSISKAGNRYLRQLLFVGAMAVIPRAKLLGASHYPWLVKLMERRSVKIAAVALANKMARIAWAMMARGESYKPALPNAA